MRRTGSRFYSSSSQMTERCCCVISSGIPLYSLIQTLYLLRTPQVVCLIHGFIHHAAYISSRYLQLTLASISYLQVRAMNSEFEQKESELQSKLRKSEQIARQYGVFRLLHLMIQGHLPVISVLRDISSKVLHVNPCSFALAPVVFFPFPLCFRPGILASNKTAKKL